MKKYLFFAVLLLGLASCQNEDCYGNQYAEPDYTSQYTGHYQVQLNISNVFGVAGMGPSYTAPVPVSFSITKDTDQCNLVWIKGLYGTDKPISAKASASELNINANASGVHPSELGFTHIGGQIDPDFDQLSVQGNFSPDKELSYDLSDNGWDMVSCSGKASE